MVDRTGKILAALQRGIAGLFVVSESSDIGSGVILTRDNLDGLRMEAKARS